MFHAKTKRRKKQRVAASADLGSEVPNLGVARALFVILVLHVAAIAAIFIHNRVTDDSLITTGGDDPKIGSLTGDPRPKQPPVIRKGEQFHILSTGDTYENVAKKYGVDVNALKDLNNRVSLRPGNFLRIPAGGAVIEVVKSTEEEGEPASDIPVKNDLHEPNFPPEHEQSTRVTPNVTLPREATAPDVPAPPVSSGGTYTVKKGDSLWRIARRHKVELASLLKTNGITNANKLRIGMTLRIPGN